MNKPLSMIMPVLRLSPIAVMVVAAVGMAVPLTGQSYVTDAALLALAIIALSFAADVFTESALGLGRDLDLNPLATGVLIIAIGTSAPEFFSSLAASVSGEPEIVIPNIVGTMAANSLLGLGIAAWFSAQPLHVSRGVQRVHIPVFIFALVLVSLSIWFLQVTVYWAVVYLTLFVAYIVYTIRLGGEVDESVLKATEEASGHGSLNDLAFTLYGLITLFLSGHLAVEVLVAISERSGVLSESLAGSVLAVGTSIPEIAAGIALARQGQADALFGQILGSNVFGLWMVLGVCGLIVPLTLAPSLFGVFFGLSIFVFLATLVTARRGQLGALGGTVIIAGFGVFLYALYAAGP